MFFNKIDAICLTESSPKREKRLKPEVISISCGRSNRLKRIWEDI